MIKKKFYISGRKRKAMIYYSDGKQSFDNFEDAVYRAERMMETHEIIDYQIVMIEGPKRKTYDRATICYMYWGDDTDYMWEEVENG